jgi:general L-amino acid transport system permease protein
MTTGDAGAAAAAAASTADGPGAALPGAAGDAPPPGPDRWSVWRGELFGSAWRSTTTLLLGALLALLAVRAADWALLHAVFRADAAACRAAAHAGACWGVIAEKLRPIAFGRYPYAEQWRPAVVTVLLLGLAAGSAWPRVWRPALAAAWAAVLGAAGVLMWGGAFGLVFVPTTRWGGLPLSLLLAIGGLAFALPLGVALALGRRSGMAVLRTLAVAYIEVVRGVPLISVLFMATFLLPLVLPGGWTLDVLLRVVVGIVLFTAAYLAEVVRGGLQAVPAGQIDAARALGLGRWQVQRHVVLPLALRKVVPALMNSVIGALKDSSLVTVVGLYELTGSLSLALGGDPLWRPFYLEGYLFVAAVYWTLCFTLSRYSLWVERRLRAGAGDPRRRR